VPAREHLQKDEIGVSCVLGVVRLGLQYVSYVACSKIHRPGTSTRGEDSHRSLAADVVLPVIRIRIPVRFGHPYGFSFTIAVAIGVNGSSSSRGSSLRRPLLLCSASFWLVLKAKEYLNGGAVPLSVASAHAEFGSSAARLEFCILCQSFRPFHKGLEEFSGVRIQSGVAENPLLPGRVT